MLAWHKVTKLLQDRRYTEWTLAWRKVTLLLQTVNTHFARVCELCYPNGSPSDTLSAIKT